MQQNREVAHEEVDDRPESDVKDSPDDVEFIAEGFDTGWSHLNHDIVPCRST
jgi:hypothetical protein